MREYLNENLTVDLVSFTTIVDVVMGNVLVLFFMDESGPLHQPLARTSCILV